MIHNLLTITENFFGGMNYMTIVFLMALESSLFPVPSEAVMIPAGYLASIGKLNIFISILAGAFGSMIGATFNYFFIGKFIGRPFITKYGKYFLIDEDKYNKTEKLFLTNDKLYTFIGRLIPVVRHLISIPAGIFEMKFPVFLLITGLGAGLWCTILTLCGYFFGESMIQFFEKYSNEVGIGACILIGIWLYFKIFKNGKKKKK
ncbi:MAG: DedA family protein [Candidatus Gracilibacteria bacterium]|nr:DedA family protein [Candidatus Gracilibacteria bacterium]